MNGWSYGLEGMVASSAPSKIFHLRFFCTINHHLPQGEMFAISCISAIENLMVSREMRKQSLLCSERCYMVAYRASYRICGKWIIGALALEETEKTGIRLSLSYGRQNKSTAARPKRKTLSVPSIFGNSHHDTFRSLLPVHKDNIQDGKQSTQNTTVMTIKVFISW